MNCDIAISVRDSIFGVPFSGDFFKEVKKLNEQRPVPYLFVQRRNGNLMYYAWSFYDGNLRKCVYACFNGVMIKHDAILRLSDAIYSIIDGNINSMLKQAESLLRNNIDIVLEELPPIDYGNSKSDDIIDFDYSNIPQTLSYAHHNSRIAVILINSENPKPKLVKVNTQSVIDKNPKRKDDSCVPAIFIGIALLLMTVFPIVLNLNYYDTETATETATETPVETPWEWHDNPIIVTETPVEIPVEPYYENYEEYEEYL